MISYIGANKHHRQRKFVRRSTKRSEVQSTCKMSRGWMMRRELRCEGLVGRAKRWPEASKEHDHFMVLICWASESWIKRRANTTRSSQYPMTEQSLASEVRSKEHDHFMVLSYWFYMLVPVVAFASS